MPSTEEALVASLKAFGLDDTEAKAYFRLIRLGKTRVSILSSALKTNRTTAYRILDRLTNLGIIESSLTRPITYNAVEPKKALGILVERKKEEAAAAASKYSTIIKEFDKFVIPAEQITTKFTVLHGNEEIHREIAKLAKLARLKLWMATASQDLSRMYYNGTFDILSDAKARGISIRIVTEVNAQSEEIIQQYSQIAEIKHQNTMPKMRMVVRDADEAIISVPGAGFDPSREEEYIALMTNSKSLASSMHMIIEREFANGVDLSMILSSIKTGRPVESVKLIASGQEYFDTCLRLLASSKSEVIIAFNFYPAFSSTAIIETIKSLAQRSVSVRILSLVRENEIKIVKEMQKFSEFRTTSFQSDVQVIIVDRSEMLISNYSPFTNITDFDKLGNQTVDPSFQINMLTNVNSLVSFMRKILSDMWLTSAESVSQVEEFDKRKMSIDCLSLLKMLIEKRSSSEVKLDVSPTIVGKSGQTHRFDLIISNQKTKKRFSISIQPYTDHERATIVVVGSKIKATDINVDQNIIAFIPKTNDESISRLAQSVGITLLQSNDSHSLADSIYEKIIS